MTTSGGRHITPESLEEYAAAAVPVTLPILGTPAASLTVDGGQETLRLSVAWDGETPPTLDSFRHLQTDVRFVADQSWVTLTVLGKRFFSDAYSLLRSIADDVQERGLTFRAAVDEGLGRYQDLLAADAHMSRDDETGLYGELLVLDRLLKEVGSSQALRSWRGDDAEEHDFGLALDDVEVKTTTAERREHWIGSLNQLAATPNRPLWVLSVQLTAAAGSRTGRRLPDLVHNVRDKIEESQRSTFDARLEAVGYRPEQPVQTYRNFQLRSQPEFHLVDETFPRLTREQLSAAGVPLEHVPQIKYLVNLDAHESMPGPLRFT